MVQLVSYSTSTPLHPFGVNENGLNVQSSTTITYKPNLSNLQLQYCTHHEVSVADTAVKTLFFFGLDDGNKIDHIFQETKESKQFANHISYETFSSSVFSEGTLEVGQKVRENFNSFLP